MHTDRRAEGARLTLICILGLGVVAVLCRLAPYYFLPNSAFVWHLMPIGALALFAGSRLRSGWAYVVPLAVMLLSDLLIHPALAARGMSAFSWGTPIFYASFVVYVLIGRLIRQGSLAPTAIGGAALLGGLQFFLVSNFVVWLRGTTYPHTLEGLLTCYLAGVPFYRNTLVADLVFTGVIFGLHASLVWGLGRLKARQPA